MKIFFRKLKSYLLVEITATEMQHFHIKQPRQNSMLRQIEWEVENRLITMKEALPLTALFFENSV